MLLLVALIRQTAALHQILQIVHKIVLQILLLSLIQIILVTNQAILLLGIKQKIAAQHHKIQLELHKAFITLINHRSLQFRT